MRLNGRFRSVSQCGKNAAGDVCRRIRANPDWKATRVLMLTARGAGGDMQRGLEAGADDYVVKPFATQDLVARVKALLG